MFTTAFLRQLPAILACGALVASGSSGAGRPGDRVHVLAAFDPAAGQNPENLAVARSGTVYVTWLFAHTVAAVDVRAPHGR
jgi:hypothetical protein